jgi:hypothetical protein
LSQLEGNTKIEGFEYSAAWAFDFHATMLQLTLNNGLAQLTLLRSEVFEQKLPPQSTFEALMEALQNTYLSAHYKIVLIAIL